MAESKIAVIMLAAGMGTRMRSALPKVLHPLAGRPMVNHLLDSVAGLGVDRVVVVVGPAMETVSRAVAPHATVIQQDRLGTGHAVAQAAPLLRDFTGTILVLYADTPLITAATMTTLVECREREQAAIAVLGFRPADPGAYGRLITAGGDLEAIVEARDASPAELSIGLCNSGVMAVDAALLPSLVSRIGCANSKGEYYLTDIVGLARADGHRCVVVEGSETELLGVNSRAELAVAEKIVQVRLRSEAMAGGATLIDPDSIHFCWDTRIGQDVTIGPQVVFGPGVEVSDNVTIRPFCHIEGARIAGGAIIGPFARLRPGAEIGTDAHIGNFVEIKAAQIEQGAKVNHLTYIGDARVGARTNIGAGVITCNYDGYVKSRTDIGADVFVGSDVALVAPVSVGDGAIIGAGSVITGDVEADALAIARGRQANMPGRAAAFRAKRGKK